MWGGDSCPPPLQLKLILLLSLPLTLTLPLPQHRDYRIEVDANHVEQTLLSAVEVDLPLF
jgi:hypothetical protein